MFTNNNFFSNILNIKKKFNIETNKEIIKIIFWGLDFIIIFKESVGMKPPAEIRLILKLRELNILTSATFNDIKIEKLKTEYKINILSKSLFILFSEFILPSPE